MRIRRCNLHLCSTLYYLLMGLVCRSITSISRFFPIKYLLLAGVSLIVIVYWRMTCCKEPDYFTCSFEPVKKKKYEKCLDGYLHGTSVGGGLGNVLFEFLSFIAIAKQTNRLPIISNEETKLALEKYKEHLPNLGSLFMKTTDMSSCNCFKNVITFSRACCRMDKESIRRIDSYNDSIRIHTFYTQGVGYLSMLPASLVSNLLEGSAAVVEMAKESLFPPDPQRHTKRNLCVHTRRGDFIGSEIVYESTEVFTEEAVKFVLKKEPNIHSIYAFGNDRVFLENIFNNWPNASIAAEDKMIPPNVEFEFSRLFCDVTLLTASASTYGWWIGYLSRGQTVYYNSNFSRPNGLELQMKRDEFFPAHWKPLELITAVRIAVF